MKTVEKICSELDVASVENLGSNTNNIPCSLAMANVFINKSTCLIPEEVLELIFGNLLNPEDVHTVLNSCAQFRRILKPRRSSDLFGLVLPLISTQLKSKDILECRLVCKSWRSAVRYLLHNHPSVRPFDLKNVNVMNPMANIHTKVTEHFGRIMPTLNLGLTFLRKYELGRVCRKMRDHSGNPFVHEMAEASTTTFVMSSQEWQLTFKFLKLHGRYITHFEMYWQDYDNCFVQFYKIMQRCLKLLPNLKTLQFGTRRVLYDPNQNIPAIHSRHEDDDKSILQRIINKYDLPLLPQLDTLIVTVREPYKSRYQRMILESLILKYEGQLKKIEVSPVLWFARFAQLSHLGHSLTELHVQTRSSTQALILKLLWTFRGYPNLRKLSFSIDEYTEGINFHSIMKAVAGIWSVRYLKFDGFGNAPSVHLNPSNDTQNENRKSVQIGNVRTLEIASEYNEFVYDTILAYLPALEYLKVEKNARLPQRHDVNDDEDVFELFKGIQERKLYESRIWVQFPLLKEIICARAMFFNRGEPGTWFLPIGPTQFLRFTRDRLESLKGK